MSLRKSVLVALSACQLVVFAVVVQGAGPSSDSEALKGLEAHLASLKGVKTLEVKFECEKRLAALEVPLESSGRLWIRGGEGGAVRFSTEKPYVSELILAEGKVHAKSQHETSWTTTNQATRPGLTAVMVQLGGWSTGAGGGLAEMYAVTRGAGKIPPRPGQKTEEAGELFVLVPVDKELAVAVRRVTMGMVGKGGNRAGLQVDARIGGDADATSRLAFLEIVTVAGGQEDVTRYWFFEGKVNGELPEGVFKAGAK